MIWLKSSQGWDDFLSSWDDFGPEDHPMDGRGPHHPPGRLSGRKTLRFRLFVRPAALLPPLAEISHKLPIRGQNVCFLYEMSMVWQLLPYKFRFAIVVEGLHYSLIFPASILLLGPPTFVR